MNKSWCHLFVNEANVVCYCCRRVIGSVTIPNLRGQVALVYDDTLFFLKKSFYIFFLRKTCIINFNITLV